MDYPILVFKALDTHYLKMNNIQQKIHVRGIIDEDVVVYKYWSKVNKKWYYKADKANDLSFRIWLNRIGDNINE
jgi:hypothetical protein